MENNKQILDASIEYSIVEGVLYHILKVYILHQQLANVASSDTELRPLGNFRIIIILGK